MKAHELQQSELPDEYQGRRNYLRKMVDDMFKNNQRGLVFECDDRLEATRVYQTIYAYTRRRHDMPCKRQIRKNTVYIENLNYKENK